MRPGMSEDRPADAAGVSGRIRSAHLSDPGRVRSNNEDAVFAEYPVFVVADGMGGQAAGEVASAIAVAQIAALAEIPVITVPDVVDAVQRANEAVVAASRRSRELAGMATTLVGLVAVDEEREEREERLDGQHQPQDMKWVAFNLGDSRIYLSDGAGLHQLSVDHSEVQALVDAGRITPLQAMSHPARHVVTRSIGATSHVVPDVWVLPRKQGQRFLICSDGLTNELDATSLADVIGAHEDAVAAAQALVHRANEAGGRDNITVVVVDTL